MKDQQAKMLDQLQLVNKNLKDRERKILGLLLKEMGNAGYRKGKARGYEEALLDFQLSLNKLDHRFKNRRKW